MVKFTSRLYIQSTIRIVPTEALALEAHAQLFLFQSVCVLALRLYDMYDASASSTALTNDDEDHRATAAGL